MPITRYLEQGSGFAPQALASMGQALEETCETIGFGGDDRKRQVAAKLISRLAQENGNLDAEGLRDKAAAALEGLLTAPGLEPRKLKSRRRPLRT
jgi:hypothetical protein